MPPHDKNERLLIKTNTFKINTTPKYIVYYRIRTATSTSALRLLTKPSINYSKIFTLRDRDSKSTNNETNNDRTFLIGTERSFSTVAVKAIFELRTDDLCRAAGE